MEKDLQSRFSHLLQPIRDLTKNWDVDVASHLEEYLTEIEQITISFDGGSTKMNFAEAALLIQGSTCVYSKKVEYLYALVYQTLDLIASRRKLAQASSVDDQGRDADVSFAQRREEDEFLGLDDLQVGTNIDLIETTSRGHSFKTVSTIPRTPMSLIPLQDSEKSTATPLLSHTGELLGSKLDFKMNTSSVHSTGALLLEPMNQLVIEVKMVHKAAIPLTYDTPAEKVKSLLMPPPTNNQMTTEEAMDDQGQLSFAGDVGGWDYSGDDEMGELLVPLSSPHQQGPPEKTATRERPARKSARVRLKQESKINDPWKLLDPHEPRKADSKPFRKGTTYKVLTSLKKTTTTRKRKNVTVTPSSPSEPLTHFLLRSFYSCSSMFPKNPMKAPLSSEFEGLYWTEQKARKEQKKKDNITLSRLRKESAVVLEQQVADEETEEEDNVENYQPLGQAEDYDDDYGVGVEGFEGAFEGFHDDHEQLQAGQPGGMMPMSHSFEGVEPMALDESSASGGSQPVVQNYEDLVRNYVECTLTGALAYVQETELSKRVQEWEDRIKPKLLKEELHPTFDIHQYGAAVLKEMKTKKSSDEKTQLYFHEITSSKEQYEICRMFAAILQLANDYNVKISWEEEGEEALGTMGLTLLSTRMAHEAVSSYRAPSLQS